MTVPATVTRMLLFLLAVTLGQTVLAADGSIYRSRDAQGNVIFSDREDEAAEPVQLPSTNTMPGTASGQAPRDAGSGASPDATVQGYRTLAITAPLDGDTITNPAGHVQVTVAVEPPLQRNHSLRLLLDGEPAGVPQHGSMDLEGLMRGDHTLQLIVVDDNGSQVQASAPVTVQMYRPVPKRHRRP